MLMIGLPFLPRSPRWLAMSEEVIKTLADIQANGNIDDPLVVAECEEIWTVLAAEREGQKGWCKFVKNGMWRRTLAGMSVHAWQQMSGDVLGTYGTPVPGGVDGNLNVVIEVTGAPAHTVIAFCYLLIIIYALTLAPVTWVYAAEVWSLETRATGMGLAAEANWLFNFALGLFISPGFRNITYKVFIIFGILCFAAAVQACLTYRETCQKTIEEIELPFSDGGPRAWRTKKGESRLDAEIAAVLERKTHGGLLYVNAMEGLYGYGVALDEKKGMGAPAHVDEAQRVPTEHK
ncbi:MFS glucose [Phlyctema vagabunda]|uniref:MFS glucose n=1 Tax=Phlyctema vagabunda TaxID=108571 RepID=A0ABR4P5V6_9HELO